MVSLFLCIFASATTLTLHITAAMTSEIFGISRHRIGTDGPGITTLVAFMGCSLHCRYCLNPQCHRLAPDADGTRTRPTSAQRISPEMLYRKVSIDDIYFQATRGGICFGGGEPALQAPFISRFAELCGRKWKISLETSLHAPLALWSTLIGVVDEWIVDVKDMNPLIYKEYTGEDSLIGPHLAWLAEHVPQERICVKVPHIPEFNSDADVRQSIQQLEEMGFSRIQEFHYSIIKP